MFYEDRKELTVRKYQCPCLVWPLGSKNLMGKLQKKMQKVFVSVTYLCTLWIKDENLDIKNAS